MARLITEGFELGTRPSNWTGDYSGVPPTYHTSPVRQNGSGHGGIYSSRTEPAYSRQHRAPFTNSSEIYCRAGVRFPQFGYGGMFMGIGQGSQPVIEILMNSSGNISFYILGLGYSVWSTQAVSLDTWYRIEVYVKYINSAAGQVILMVDGEIWMTMSGANDYYSVGYLNSFILQGAFNGYSPGQYTYWDDIAVNDTTGSFNNTWCGEGYVSLLNVNGAGTTTQLSPNTGSNYTCVDDGVTVNDADYVYTDTAGNIDLYTLENTPASAVIVKNLTLNARGTKIGTTVTKGQTVLRTNAVNYFSSDNTLASLPTYTNFSQEYGSNPNTAAVWTKANVDGLEIGFKSIA